MDFPVSSADCRLLVLLENTGSIRDVAKTLGRDVSVVSRQIGKIAETAPLVEKIEGKWQVSALGRQFTAWARDSILVQNRILQNQTLLRIVTTREFAARILAPQLEAVRGDDKCIMIEIIASPSGIETLLLKGEADIGLDCGAPRDPSIKFHRITQESFSIVAAPIFLKRWQTSRFSDLLKTPHLQVQSRLSAAKLLKLDADALNPCALFHDLAAARAACIGGSGWSLLPTYSVKQELDSGTLIEVHGKGFPKIEPEWFGVWWLRERRGVDIWVEKMTTWLKKQKLS